MRMSEPEPVPVDDAPTSAEAPEAPEAPAKPDMLAGWTTPGDRGATVLRLEEPVELGSTYVERLTIRRMRAKELRLMRDDSTDSMLAVLEALANESRRVIDDLVLADAMRALEVVRRGFPAGLVSGEAS